jgi:hypothetical protein
MREKVKELLPFVIDFPCRKNVADGIRILQDYAAGKPIPTKEKRAELLQKIAQAASINYSIDRDNQLVRRRKHAQKIENMFDLIDAERGVTIGAPLCFIENIVREKI